MTICAPFVPGARLMYGLMDTRTMMPEESTTPDPGELAGRMIKPSNERDLDAVMAFYASDAVWDTSPMGMGTFKGQAATRGSFEDRWASYEEYVFEAEELFDLGNRVSFGVLLQRGRPVGSSGEVQLRYAAVGVGEGDKTKHLTNHIDIDEARAAAERLAEEWE